MCLYSDSNKPLLSGRFVFRLTFFFAPPILEIQAVAAAKYFKKGETEMLKHYLIDVTSLSEDEYNRFQTFLEGYAHNFATDLNGTFEILLDESRPLEGLPQVPASCKITLLSKM